MIVVQSINDARIAVAEARSRGKTVSFVPTMGALHEGHLSLIRLGKNESSFCVLSIFVNKIQFNDSRDFEKYPRDYDHDLALAEIAGCDMVFLPDDAMMYSNQRIFVIPEYLDEYLCGASRPGHFRGVCTVVMKLFNIIQPDLAFFGQKDIQQSTILRKMVFDLNAPVSLVIAPIVREKDGLAMSSRNTHLSGEQRTRAASIHKSLKAAERLIHSGERNSAVIENEVRSIIDHDGNPEKIDYVSVVDYDSLHPKTDITGKSVLAVAAFFGKTRLIDNMIINTGEIPPCVY